MKKHTFLLVLLALMLDSYWVTAQRAKGGVPLWYRSRFYTTVGGGINSMHYVGDITPSPSLLSTDLAATRVNFSGFVMHKFTPSISGRAALSLGRITGDDSKSADPTKKEDAGRYIRNTHFRNDIIELTVSGVYDFIKSTQPFFKRPTIAPYASLGIGVIYHNPKARTPVPSGSEEGTKGAEWVALQPLGTEGQGREGYKKPYARIQPVIPISVGFRYKLSQRIDLGVEVGYRFTFTDYLDDVSGTYADPSVFEPGSLAAQMSNRALEELAANTGKRRKEDLSRILVTNYGRPEGVDPFAPGSFTNPQKGTIRGSKGKDAYVTAGFHISYILVNVVQRPRFR